MNKTKSKATKRTKQVWVAQAVHLALLLESRDQGKTIRIIVERVFLERFGVKSLTELQKKLLEQFGCDDVNLLAQAADKFRTIDEIEQFIKSKKAA